MVTYRSLSFMFDVHTNLAKQMLYHFVKQQELKNKMDSLNITYFVSGVIFKNGSMPKMHKVMVVRGKNLEKIKKQFEEVVSVHIYSIQKTKLKDLITLYTADCDGVTDDIFSATKHSRIRCQLEGVKSEVDTKKLSKQHICQSDDEFQQVQAKVSAIYNKASQKAANKDSKKKNMKSYLKKISSPQKKSLVSLAPPSNTHAILDPPPLKKIGSTQNSVADNTSADASGGFCKEFKQESLEEGVNRGKIPRSSNKAILSRGKHNMKTLIPSAKRNRIMQLDDSESSDSEINASTGEDPIPPTRQDRPSVDLTKSRERTRKRKLIDTTFMDDDGFLVTKTGYVYFSCSDDEEPLPSKKSVASAVKTETNVSSDKSRYKSSPKKMRKSPVKNKQSSIMNFFKKK